MKLVERIADCLSNELVPVSESSDSSTCKGLYSIGYAGSELQNVSVPDSKIIYIGKSESSGNRRVLHTHFKEGKTGSSTLRRTLGALLRDQLNLQPISRSTTEKSDRRFTNYKFCGNSEEKLSKWMNDNLTIAFFPIEGTLGELKSIEKKIIALISPPLNLQHNSNNLEQKLIKKSRKECVFLAKKWEQLNGN